MREKSTDTGFRVAGFMVMRKLIRLGVVGILGASAMLMAQEQSSVVRAERQLFLSVNRARTAQGLPDLKWNDGLALAARRHAAVMAQHGTAGHGFAGEPALAARVSQAGVRFVWLSENVCQGSGADAIQAEFMGSANHRANILDRDMDSVGIGVVERGGQVFAVEDFSKVK